MQDTSISISKAQRILGVSSERITWFIATGKLLSMKNPKDRSQKLVSLQDVYKLRNLPSLLARWVIYALVDPLDNEIRYIGQAYEPQTRFLQHMNGYTSNHAKYDWICCLKKKGLQPRMEVLEGINSSVKVVNDRERYWIQYYLDRGARLTNIRTTAHSTSPTLDERVRLVELNELRKRLLQHLKSTHGENPAKYQWMQKLGSAPLNGGRSEACRFYWKYHRGPIYRVLLRFIESLLPGCQAALA